MYTTLVRLMILAALLELGGSLDFSQLNDPAHVRAVINAVLTVNWKPISVFPEEAKRFRKQSK